MPFKLLFSTEQIFRPQQSKQYIIIYLYTKSKYIFALVFSILITLLDYSKFELSLNLPAFFTLLLIILSFLFVEPKQY